MKDLACIVLPFRYGDALNALPIAKHWHDEGEKIWWVIHEQFIDLFDGISYVKPISFTGRMNDIRAATDVARNEMAAEGRAGRIHILKSGNISPPIEFPTEHFTSELWERAGTLAHYHDWPLEIDKRDTAREADLVDRVMPPGDKPLLAYCLKGHSFKYPHAASTEAWLLAANEAAGSPWRLLNIGDIGARRIYDMLAMLERATCLFTIDTAFVHLAACGLPTAVIVQERDYDSPEPQYHWIGRLRGSQTVTPAGRSELHKWLFEWDNAERRLNQGRLCRPQSAMYAAPVLFGVAPPDGDVGIPQQAEARQSYRAALNQDRYWIESDILLPIGHLGAGGVMDLLLQMSPSAGTSCPAKYLVMARPDMCLAADAPHLLRQALNEGRGCAYSGHAAVAAPHGGMGSFSSTDLADKVFDARDGIIAVDIAWWQERRAALPDPLNWATLWEFCRREGAPAPAPAAYRLTA